MGDLTKVIIVGPDGEEATVVGGLLQTSGGGGGGGGAVTIADGADVAEGTKADAAWDGIAASATVVAILKRIAAVAGGSVPPVTAGPTLFNAPGSLDIALAGNIGVGEVIVFANFTGQIRHFASYDGGVTFPTLIPFAEVDTGVIRPNTETETAETSTDVHFIMVPPGATHVRFDIPAVTGGTATVFLRADNLAAAGLAFPGLGVNGSTILIQAGWQLGGTPTGAPGQQFLTAGVTNTAPLGSAPGLINRNISGMAAIGGTDPADGLVQYMGGKNLTTNDARFVKLRDELPSVGDTGLITRPVPQVRSTGPTVLGALNDTIAINITGFQSIGGWIDSSTLAGQLIFEVSADGGVTWFPQYVYSNAGHGQVFNLINPAPNQFFSFLLSGSFTDARVRMLAYISGAVTVTLRAAPLTDAYALLTTGLNGQVVPQWSTLISGADGTTLRQVVMKAASTAAVVADPSLVVALSPNSPLPAGVNAIGIVTAEVSKWLGSTAPTVGQKAMASSLPVVVASDQTPIAAAATATAAKPLYTEGATAALNQTPQGQLRVADDGIERILDLLRVLISVQRATQLQLANSMGGDILPPSQFLDVESVIN